MPMKHNAPHYIQTHSCSDHMFVHVRDGERYISGKLTTGGHCGEGEKDTVGQT